MKSLLSELLAEKGPVVHTVDPDETVVDAVQYMNNSNIGALIVMQHNNIVGIFTERDVLMRVVTADLDPVTTPVKQVMTSNPVCVMPNMPVEDAMLLVTAKRFRHLPVVENGVLRGLISSGDLTRWMVRDQRHQIDGLSAYITDTPMPSNSTSRYG